MLMDLTSDLRTAVRMTLRNPGTSSLIVFTLALAIAASTIGFTFADLALFRGLPVDDSARSSRSSRPTHTAPMVGRAFRLRTSSTTARRTTTLEQLSAIRDGRAPLDQEWPVANADGQLRAPPTSLPRWVSLRSWGACFSGARIRGSARRSPCCRITTGATRWTPSAMRIGRTLQIGREMVTWSACCAGHRVRQHRRDRSLAAARSSAPTARATRANLRFIGRLRDGVSFDRAAAEMAAIGDALANEFPLTNRGWKVRLIPIRELTGRRGLLGGHRPLPARRSAADGDCNRQCLEPDDGARAGARARAGGARTALGARRWPVAAAVPDRRPAALGDRGRAVDAGRLDRAAGDRRRSRPRPVFQQLRIDWHELGFVATLALVVPGDVFTRVRPHGVGPTCGRSSPRRQPRLRPRR